MLQILGKKRNLTCSSSNWSPPNAETQGLIPPVPRAIKNRPTIDRILHARTKISPLQNLSSAYESILVSPNHEFLWYHSLLHMGSDAEPSKCENRISCHHFCIQYQSINQTAFVSFLLFWGPMDIVEIKDLWDYFSLLWEQKIAEINWEKKGRGEAFPVAFQPG